MRVLYFGTYERGYPRNSQVISCLRRAGVEVDERHRAVWEPGGANWTAGTRAALRLLAAELRLLRRAEPYDALVVGYPGHFDLPAARQVAQGRPVVFNPLVALADTLVTDRGRFRPGSPPARLLRAVDRYAFRAADAVVADTEVNAEHFARLAGLPRHRLEVCLVGAEERLFQPGWSPGDGSAALFVGKLIPLHGLSAILEAASLAPDLPIRVIGRGQLESLLAARPANVEWVPWVDYERLPAELHRAGCALGIFGTSAKACRVIPNKVYQALACGTPVITADTPAARELLVDGESALLVPPGDARALAEAVRRLLAEPGLAERIGAGGLTAYRTRASEDVLGARWRALLERLA